MRLALLQPQLRCACAALWIGLLAGCSSPAELVSSGPQPALLPELPAAGPYWSRQVSDVTSQIGSDRYQDCAEPGALPDVPFTGALQLDGTAASEYAWSIWRFALTPETVIEKFKITLTASGLSPYYTAYADYTQHRWVVSDVHGGGTTVFPVDESSLHSADEYAYLAILVAPDSIIKVAQIEMTAEGPPLPGPIFDQFEDNDEMDIAYPLTAGMYHASIHESYRGDIPAPEQQDFWDFYSIDLQAGQTLTLTLRYEVFDHFHNAPLPNYNDLDLLFYTSLTTNYMNDFIEQYSGLRIYYAPFEHCVYTADAARTIYIGIRGDSEASDPVDNNAEYYLGVAITNGLTYTVTGNISVLGEIPNRDVVVFLEAATDELPGNYNYVTALPPGNAGYFEITGVPDGDYTLWVHGTARYGPSDFVWPESLLLTVDGADLSGMDLDLSDYPGL